MPHLGRLDAVGYLICLGGIVRRELLRFFNQKERFFSALVRPLVWLFIFAAGFRNTLGVSIEPPYQTYVLYEVYVVPGLAVMIQLFNGMQSSLSMVYDREVGSMKVLLTSPYPRWLLLLAKLIAGVTVSVVQAYAFLAIAWFWELDIPAIGYVAALPAFIAAGLMLGAIGLLLSSMVKQLENFASVMNFVIFPMFFASSALYPLWRIRESSETLYWICRPIPSPTPCSSCASPSTGSSSRSPARWCVGTTLAFFTLAVVAYDPGRGIMARRGGPAGDNSS